MRTLYVVDLTDNEIATLRELVRTGSCSARKLTRAHILLPVNDGARDQSIADALPIGRTTVERVRTRFVEGTLERARTDAKRPGAKRTQVQPRRALGRTCVRDAATRSCSLDHALACRQTRGAH